MYEIFISTFYNFTSKDLLNNYEKLLITIKPAKVSESVMIFYIKNIYQTVLYCYQIIFFFVLLAHLEHL